MVLPHEAPGLLAKSVLIMTLSKSAPCEGCESSWVRDNHPPLIQWGFSCHWVWAVVWGTGRVQALQGGCVSVRADFSFLPHRGTSGASEDIGEIDVTKGEHFPSRLARDRQNLEAKRVHWCHHCKAGALCCSDTGEWGTWGQDTSGSCVPHSSSNLPPAWTPLTVAKPCFMLSSPSTEPALGGEGLPLSLPPHCPHRDTAQMSWRRTLFPPSNSFPPSPQNSA